MNADKPQTQKRESGRFELRAHATLANGKGNWPAHVLNLSAAGTLIAITEKHSLQNADQVQLVIELKPEQSLRLDGRVVHVKDHYVGLECEAGSEEDRAALQTLLDRFQEGDPVEAHYGNS